MLNLLIIILGIVCFICILNIYFLSKEIEVCNECIKNNNKEIHIIDLKIFKNEFMIDFIQDQNKFIDEEKDLLVIKPDQISDWYDKVKDRIEELIQKVEKSK